MTIDGLGVIHPDFENNNIIVDQLVPINEKTVDDLAAMALSRPARGAGSRCSSSVARLRFHEVASLQ